MILLSDVTVGVCADVAVDMPDTVDLSYLRASGLQPGEEELPEQKVPEPGEHRAWRGGAAGAECPGAR